MKERATSTVKRCVVRVLAPPGNAKTGEPSGSGDQDRQGIIVMRQVKIRTKFALAVFLIALLPILTMCVLYIHLFQQHDVKDHTIHVIFLSCCAIAVLFGLITAYVAGRRMAQPLEQLSEAARQVAWGSLSIDLGDLTQRNDEYGELANSFNEMAVGLKGKINLLQLSQSQLELRNDELQKEIAHRQITQQQKDDLHEQLISASRQAGMAEIATAVLHNVGNVLNSINVSTTMLTERMNHSQLQNFLRVTQLIQEHRSDLAYYIEHDHQGRHLPDALLQLADAMESDYSTMSDEIAQMLHDVDHIKQIISAQQSYVTHVDVDQSTDPGQVFDDALAINEAGISQRDIRVTREYNQLPNVHMDKHKVLQILVNLISNAKHALGQLDGPRHIRLQLELTQKDKRNILNCKVIDNGCGISAENLTRIFSHGYSTRVDGRGYGLHYSILTATEMGGTLTAQSPGIGQGATFTLSIPVTVDQPATV